MFATIQFSFSSCHVPNMPNLVSSVNTSSPSSSVVQSISRLSKRPPSLAPMISNHCHYSMMAYFRWNLLSTDDLMLFALGSCFECEHSSVRLEWIACAATQSFVACRLIRRLCVRLSLTIVAIAVSYSTMIVQMLTRDAPVGELRKRKKMKRIRND